MTVLCTEGRVVVAGPADGIDFGGVTSCMTITCILDDGSKVAAHDAVFKRVKPQIIYALKGRIGALGGRTVNRVIAAGAGDFWTPQMASQQEVVQAMRKNTPALAKAGDLAVVLKCAPFLIGGSAANRQKFEEILCRDLGAPSASFTEYDFGRIQITPQGELHTGEA